jgi:CSLREA domain-containing protein
MAAAFVVLFAFGVSAAAAATITVNATGDSVTDSGSCTLREAITSSNSDSASGVNPGECAAGSGTDVIAFSLTGAGPHTIQPATELPDVVTPMTIDGSTEPDEVILDGSLTSFDVGLDFDAGSSTVKDLSIVSWGYGVRAGATGTQILDSRIGTNEADAVGLGSTVVGVLVEVGDNVLIQGNVISGSGQQGIRCYDAGVSGLTIRTNLIGTDSTGTTALPNLGGGIAVVNVDGLVVGGTLLQGNLISGNGGAASGISLSGDSGESADDALIRNNRIGTNLAGTAALDNYYGVSVKGDVRSASVEDNLISGNTMAGILIDDVVSESETPSALSVTGNRIGVNQAGDAVVANGKGIWALNATSPFGAGVTIGGVTGLTAGACTGDCNVIAGSSGGPGVLVDSGADHVAVLGNSIGGNFGLGIDLSGPLVGVTANDIDDVDIGPNGLQNFPKVDAALAIGGSLLVTGRLDSTPDENFRVEVFSSATPDPSDHGEGEFFQGGFTVSTPPSDSRVHFARQLVGPFPNDAVVTATATRLDPATNRPATSEFGPVSAEGCEESGSGSGEELVADETGQVLCGLGGDDNLKSGEEGDILFGGTGSDTADFSDTADPVAASLALDQAAHGPIDLLVEVENLTGSPQVDLLAGGPGANLIRGLDGADQINPAAGADTVYGGPQDDEITVDDGVADVLVDCGPGNDTVTADPTATEPASMFVDCETIDRPLEPPPTCDTDPSLCPPPPPDPVFCDGVEATIVGTSGAETILGTSGRDVIVAFGGKDLVKSRDGNDLVCAGDGTDEVRGGPGNDKVYGQAGTDSLFGEADQDTLYGGDAKDTVKGGAAKDTLNGGAGTDRIEGGDGDDLLKGVSGGKDELYGQAGKDKLDGESSGGDLCNGGDGSDRKSAPGCEKKTRIP